MSSHFPVFYFIRQIWMLKGKKNLCWYSLSLLTLLLLHPKRSLVLLLTLSSDRIPLVSSQMFILLSAFVT